MSDIREIPLAQRPSSKDLLHVRINKLRAERLAYQHGLDLTPPQSSALQEQRSILSVSLVATRNEQLQSLANVFVRLETKKEAREEVIAQLEEAKKLYKTGGFPLATNEGLMRNALHVEGYYLPRVEDRDNGNGINNTLLEAVHHAIVVDKNSFVKKFLQEMLGEPIGPVLDRSAVIGDRSIQLDETVGRSSAVTSLHRTIERTAKDTPLNDKEIDFAIAYMNYNDVFPDSREGHSRFLNESKTAKYYVREAQAMFNEYGKDVMLDKAGKNVQKLLGVLEFLDIKASLASTSPSWYIWHAAKSRFLAMHPKIQATMPNADKYNPFDPLLQYKPGVLAEAAIKSQKAEQEILETMVGWEIYTNYRVNGANIMAKLRPDMPLVQRDELTNLLTENPHADKKEGTLSTYKLQRIGELVIKL